MVVAGLAGTIVFATGSLILARIRHVSGKIYVHNAFLLTLALIGAVGIGIVMVGLAGLDMHARSNSQ